MGLGLGDIVTSSFVCLVLGQATRIMFPPSLEGLEPVTEYLYVEGWAEISGSGIPEYNLGYSGPRDSYSCSCCTR